jgi:hypothetical protein
MLVRFSRAVALADRREGASACTAATGGRTALSVFVPAAGWDGAAGVSTAATDASLAGPAGGTLTVTSCGAAAAGAAGAGAGAGAD